MDRLGGDRGCPAEQGLRHCWFKPPRTLQRWRQTEELREDGRVNRTFTPSHKLSEAERAEVIATVNREEFKQLTPHQIVPRLAERGEYLASESTFYRILKAESLLAHRHACRAPRQVSKPKAFVATGPNQLYSWDITYLATTVKGLFFYLYLFMDIFSRKIVGWQVWGSYHIAAKTAIFVGMNFLYSKNVRTFC